jgi:hypothetical protein
MNTDEHGYDKQKRGLPADRVSSGCAPSGMDHAVELAPISLDDQLKHIPARPVLVGSLQDLSWIGAAWILSTSFWRRRYIGPATTVHMKFRVWRAESSCASAALNPIAPCASAGVRPFLAACRARRHTNPTFRSIVLITESIFPFSTCLARLSVNPPTVRNGKCDGSDKA